MVPKSTKMRRKRCSKTDAGKREKQALLLALKWEADPSKERFWLKRGVDSREIAFCRTDSFSDSKSHQNELPNELEININHPKSRSVSSSEKGTAPKTRKRGASSP